MTRRGPFKEMFDLAIGRDVLMHPMEGESIEAALKRLKVRASKYRAEGRSYRLTQEGDTIRVQRVPFGTTNKLASWEGMIAGEQILLNDRPTPKQIAAAKQSVNYLNSVKEGRGVWHADTASDGRLFVTCLVDRQGNVFDPPRKDVIVTSLTPEQKAAALLTAYEGIAAHVRKEANSASHGTKEALLHVASGYESRAADLAAELARGARIEDA